MLERRRLWVTLRLYDPKVPLIPITECPLSSQVRGASGSDNEFRLEKLWIEGGSIIIVHIKLMVTTRSISSNLKSWTSL